MKKIYILILLSALFTLRASAQKSESKEPHKLMASQMGISEERAKDLLAAMNFNRAEIQRTLRDTTLKGQAKQQKLRELSQQQQAMVRARLSPAERGKLSQVMAPLREEAEKRRKAAEEEHRKYLEKKN